MLLKIFEFNKYFAYFLIKDDNDYECSVSHIGILMGNQVTGCRNFNFISFFIISLNLRVKLLVATSFTESKYILIRFF